MIVKYKHSKLLSDENLSTLKGMFCISALFQQIRAWRRQWPKWNDWLMVPREIHIALAYKKFGNILDPSVTNYFLGKTQFMAKF